MDNAVEKINNTGKNVLLRVSNLKQYFPVKRKRNTFVKANDGISLNIYEGETIGVVGESGCGKSTLGRVLLQLYRQTAGETLYFGRTRDSLSPKYVLDMYQHLTQRCQEAKALRESCQKLEQEVSGLEKAGEGSAEFFKKRDELVKTSREADNAFLNIVNLVGGFFSVSDHSGITPLLLKLHQATSARCKTERKLEAARLAVSGKEGGKASDPRIAELEKESALNQAAIDQCYAEIDKVRAKYADDPDFQKYEAYRNDGIDLARLTPNEMNMLRKDMQIIFQDPYSSLNPRMTIGQIISEGVTTHNYYAKNDSRLQDYTMKIMEQCGLAPYMIHRYPHQFSGGQRQRIGIARSLAVKPRFIVCDEAVSALDVSIQSQIINLLQELKEQENLTYMFISHDLSVVKYISDRIAVMYLGNIVELASSADLFARPTHPYTEALLNAIPTTEEHNEADLYLLQGDIPSPINPPKGCKFHTRCRYCSDICKEVTPEFLEVEPGHFVACHSRKNL
jgi:peptide/nickel transport system ATP-binding protein